MNRSSKTIVSSLLIGSLLMLSLLQAIPRSMAFGNLTLTPEADTYVDPSRPDFNFGASPVLKVDYSRGTVSYVKFNLSTIPKDVEIVEAKLLLYLQSKSSESTSKIDVYLTTNNTWHELRLSWISRPNQSTLLYTNDTIAFTGGWQSWVVTEAVANASSSAVSFVLIGSDATGENAFASKDSTHRPRLEVRFGYRETTPPVIDAVSISPVTPSSEDEVTVSASVVDEGSGLDVVELRYRVDSGEWSGVGMSYRGGVFEGVIPRQSGGAAVEYYVTATDNAGNSASSPISIYLVEELIDGEKPPQPYSRSLSVAPEADSYVDPFRPDFNFGASPVLKVDFSRGTVSYLRFNITVPNNVEIVEARLLLYLQTKSSEITSKIGVHLTTDNTWHELRLDWLNRPSSQPSPIYINDTVTLTGRWYSWSVTDAVTRSSSNIISLAVIGGDATGENVFASKDSANSPRLEVVYTSEIDDSTPPEIGAMFISPDDPSPEDEVTVSASVVDEGSGLDVVELLYRVDGEDWSSVRMIDQGSAFAGVIPRQRSGAIIEYYVRVVDRAGNNSTSTRQQFQVDRPDYYYSLQEEFDTLKARFDELMANYQSVKLEADLMKLEYDSLSENYTDLQMTFEAIQRTYEELKNRFDAVQKSFESLQSEVDQARLNLSRANTLTSSLQIELEEARTEMENVEAELAKSEGELIGNKEYLRWALSELNSTRSELSRVASQLNSTQTRLQNTDADYSSAKGSLIQWQIVSTAALGSVAVVLLVLRKYPRKKYY